MKKIPALVLLTTILLQTCFAQTKISISSFNKTPTDFQLLLLSNKEIADNDTINERIVDLVNPVMADSVIERRKQHHKVFLVGWMIHAFGGFNWRAVSMKKEKFVGTAVRNSRSSEEEYTEYDINYDLNFHLKKYLWRVFDAYDLQKKYHKQDVRPSHRTNYKTIPFVRDTNLIDIKNYRLHCELTPPRAFRPQLHYLFYPTMPGLTLKDHPNFESEKPAVGFYGTLCLDCNHNCHPELHPYEWMWWLKAKEDDELTDKTWVIGFFHEGSNRVKKWSVNPMTGTISIPFAFDYKMDYNEHFQIDIEHLVFNKFIDSNVVQFNPSENTFLPNVSSHEFTFVDDKNLSVNGLIKFNNILLTKGLKYWFSDLNADEETHVLSGYLNLAVSAQDLYTTRIKFSRGRVD
jgi:hypothetical protein